MEAEGFATVPEERLPAVIPNHPAEPIALSRGDELRRHAGIIRSGDGHLRLPCRVEVRRGDDPCPVWCHATRELHLEVARHLRRTRPQRAGWSNRQNVAL